MMAVIDMRGHVQVLFKTWQVNKAYGPAAEQNSTPSWRYAHKEHDRPYAKRAGERRHQRDYRRIQ